MRLGSCVLVQLLGRDFVVTAAHILHASNCRPIYLGRRGSKLIELSELRIARISGRVRHGLPKIPLSEPACLLSGSEYSQLLPARQL